MNNDIQKFEDEISRLKVAVSELAILNEIAVTISSVVDLDQIVHKIIQKCIKHLHVEQGAVMLLDNNDQDAPLRTFVRKGDSKTGQLPYRLDSQLTGWMIKNQQPLLSNDILKDERFQISKEDFVPFKSLLAVPLQLKGKMIGSLMVFNKSSKDEFSENDQRLLTIIGAQSSQVIENARLYKEEQKFRKIQQEMSVAKDIQLNLLPKNTPSIPDYKIFGISIPASEVGGDYFDFITINDNKLAFCLGDVSGKGISAAMLMANLQATFRSQTQMSESTKQCLDRSNKLLYHSTDSAKYATFFCGVLDSGKNIIRFSNAGHNSPIFMTKNKEVKRIQTSGIVLGFLEDYEFTESFISINSGDCMVIFSDGISEAMNAMEEEFGEERLINLLLDSNNQNAESIVKKIIQSVNEFVGAEPQSDDMTVVVIKRD